MSVALGMNITHTYKAEDIDEDDITSFYLKVSFSKLPVISL